MRLYQLVFAATTIALACWPKQVRSQVANPTRPKFSDNANPMAKGFVELELGGQFWNNDQISTPFLIKLGLSDNAEFKLGGDGLRWNGLSDSFGFGNIVLINKLRFSQADKARPAFALLVQVALPTAQKDVGSGNASLSTRIALSGAIASWSYDINLGLDVNGLEDGYDQATLGLPAFLALSLPLAGPLGGILEIADVVGLYRQQNQFNLLAGLTWSIHPGLVCDLAFIKGYGDSVDWQVLFGFTATLMSLW